MKRLSLLFSGALICIVAPVNAAILVTGTISTREVYDAHLNGQTGATQLASGFMELGQSFSILYNLEGSPTTEGKGYLIRVLSPDFLWDWRIDGTKYYTSGSGTEMGAGEYSIPSWLIQKNAWAIGEETNYLTDKSKKIAISNTEQAIVSLSFYGLDSPTPSIYFYVIGQNSGAGIFVKVTDVSSFEVAGIPEPGTWICLVTGFFIVGAVVRRTKFSKMNPSV